MNSKNKGFLEELCVKESSNLISLENFRTAGFSITAMLGWYSPNQSKSDQTSTYQSPSHTKLLHSLHERLTPLLLLEVKIFNKKISPFFCLWCTFVQEVTIYHHESLSQAEKF